MLRKNNMILCKYGANNKFIDVNNIVFVKFRKDNFIHLPNGNKYFNDVFCDPCPGVIKSLIITIGDDKYNITELDTAEYTITIPIYCEYGGDNTFANVTNSVLINFVENDSIHLNKNKYFNTYFGDTCPGIEKMLKIYIGDSNYEIPEYDNNEYKIELSDSIITYTNKIKKIICDDNLITFIIPTINRMTLLDTLDSLLQQMDKYWKAICIFDGVEPNDEIKLKLESDNRFDYLVLSEKLGQSQNSAGLVRNIGIEKVTTKWVGFVDDDDTLAPYYVNCLKDELINSNDIDCVIFRMMYTTIMPLPHHTDFHRNAVGISFSYKTELFNEGFHFIPSSGEDHDLLSRFKDSGKKIVISPHVTYKVRGYTLNPNIKQIDKYCIRSWIN